MNKLVVGRCSTWSMRALLCAKLANVSVELIPIPLGEEGYQEKLIKYSETMLVPLLLTEDIKVHDSLAIAEYLNEISNNGLYPKNIKERAIARSLAAELHSGFFQLRGTCPFTFESVEAVSLDSKLIKELDRLITIFEAASGTFMFEQPGAIDAFYAVLAYRMKHYGIQLEGRAGEYQNALVAWPLFNEVLEEAKCW